MSNQRPIINTSGQMRELPTGDFALGGGLVRDTLDAAETLTIPAGYQYLVHGFELNGVVDMEGKLVLL